MAKKAIELAPRNSRYSGYRAEILNQLGANYGSVSRIWEAQPVLIEAMGIFRNLANRNAHYKKFYDSMMHINSFRIDAHAKQIDEDDFQMLQLEFKWVEKCLINVKI